MKIRPSQPGTITAIQDPAPRPPPSTLAGTPRCSAVQLQVEPSPNPVCTPRKISTALNVPATQTPPAATPTNGSHQRPPLTRTQINNQIDTVKPKKPRRLVPANAQSVLKTPHTKTQWTHMIESTSLNDLIIPVATPQTTAFFAEHERIKEGLTQARAHNPEPIPFPKSPTEKISKVEQTAGEKLTSRWKRDTKPSPKDTLKHSSLVEYNKRFRGLNTASSEPLHGKSTTYSGYAHLSNTFQDVSLPERNV